MSAMANGFAVVAPTLGISLAWLLLSGILTTLYASLGVSQEAGLQRLVDKFPDATRRVQRWDAHWDLLRAAVFAAAMVCAIGGVATALQGLDTTHPYHPWILVGVVMVTALVLSLLLNVIPHVLSEGYADLTSVRGLPVAVFLSRLLFPLAWPLAWLEHRLLSWTLAEADDDNRPSQEEEILSLVDRTPEAVLELEEREMIRSVFEFGDTVARESMTPRVAMEGLEQGSTVAACCAQVVESPFSRFPVYDETLDRILGMVHVKDLLRRTCEEEGESGTVGSMAKDITFVPESISLNDLLQLLRSEKEQLAIVVDEYGGTAGLITVEDILEELVGDIHDEYDNESMVVQRLPNGGVILDARMSVADANRLLEIALPESDEYDSLGGLVYHHSGRIPHPGERIELDELRLTVQSASPRTVQTLLVSPPPGPGPAPAPPAET